MKDERKAQRSQRQNEHGARRGQGRLNNKKGGKEESERGRSGRSFSEKTWGEQGKYFSAPPERTRAKEEEVGGDVQKKHGAKKRNILAQARKKGRRRKREKRKAQIENGDE